MAVLIVPSTDGVSGVIDGSAVARGKGGGQTPTNNVLIPKDRGNNGSWKKARVSGRPIRRNGRLAMLLVPFRILFPRLVVESAAPITAQAKPSKWGARWHCRPYTKSASTKSRKEEKKGKSRKTCQVRADQRRGDEGHVR